MLFYYIRHGDPVYSPDSLTPLGQRQAEAIGKRLAMHGLDEIYASTSNRAIETARPAAEMLHKTIHTLDFANESHAWDDFHVDTPAGGRWAFQDPNTRMLFHEPSVRELGFRWYEHPAFTGCHFQSGTERMYRETDAFFASLGYEHIPGTGKYKVLAANSRRIALFAHQGFGLAFMSCLLDIPYPQFATHFDMGHSDMTVIDFRDEGGYCLPRVCMFSSDGHSYKEGLPTFYNDIDYI